MDPAGAYGLGIIKAANSAEVDDFIARDLAIVIKRYEYHQMLALTPDQTS